MQTRVQRSRQFVYGFIRQLIDAAADGLKICHTNNRGLGLTMQDDKLSSESKFVF